MVGWFGWRVCRGEGTVWIPGRYSCCRTPFSYRHPGLDPGSRYSRSVIEEEAGSRIKSGTTAGFGTAGPTGDRPQCRRLPPKCLARGAPTLCAARRLLIDQHGLLPMAWCLVVAVDTACPAAGPPLSPVQFFTGSRDPAVPGFWLFRVINPADEFVTPQRRQALPQRKGFGIRSDSRLQIRACLMNGAVKKSRYHDAAFPAYLPIVPANRKLIDFAPLGTSIWAESKLSVSRGASVRLAGVIVQP